MMDIDNKNKYSNDNFLLGKIGAFIKYHRKNQNKTQKILAHEAGVNRSTLSEFENGKNSNIITLIQILRALDQLSVLDTFEIKETISPLALAKLRKKERQRIRTKKKTIPLSKSDW
ncbi:MAG: helix-turn-helix domain-containing protein [Saprospiraceae bacterium]|nr:helix-turn-helix domain-containing protein [Saprospiraceae bacterium]